MIRLHLLGPPEVLDDRGAVLLPPKLLALVSYATLAPVSNLVRRDVLLATFWPDADVDSARNALNQAIYEVRQCLGRDVLESRGKAEVAVGASVYIDARDFQARLAEGRRADALGLYRGDLLDGLHIAGASPFERWVDDARFRLRRSAAAAAAEEAAIEHAKGDASSAASWLARALDVDPTDETIGRRLMQLHIEAGDRAAALHAYQRLARSLRLELDVAPDNETRRVARLATTGDSPRPAPVAEVEVVRRPTVERRLAGDLLDRASELAAGDRTANAVARELLSQATRLDPAFGAARAAHACALADWVSLFGGPRQAARVSVEEANVAVRLNPTSVEAHIAWGCGLEAMARFADAIAAFRDALSLRPRHPEGVSRLGRAHMYAGDAAASRRVARDAARHREEDADLLLQLGMADFVLDRHDDARESTASALRLRPAFHYAEAAWAFYEIVHGHFAHARATLDRLLAREPDSFMGHFFRGDLALVQRDFATALASYQRCYDIDPTGRPVGLYLSSQTLLGVVHVKAGDRTLGHGMLTAAEADVRSALRAGAEFGGFFLELAIVAACRGERDRAVDLLTRAYRKGYLQYHLIARHPAFDDLRGRPDYQALVAAIQRDVAQQRRRAL